MCFPLQISVNAIIHQVLNREQVEIYLLYITSCLFPVTLSGVNGRSGQSQVFKLKTDLTNGFGKKKK